MNDLKMMDALVLMMVTMIASIIKAIQMTKGGAGEGAAYVASIIDYFADCSSQDRFIIMESLKGLSIALLSPHLGKILDNHPRSMGKEDKGLIIHRLLRALRRHDVWPHYDRLFAAIRSRRIIFGDGAYSHHNDARFIVDSAPPGYALTEELIPVWLQLKNKSAFYYLLMEVPVDSLMPFVRELQDSITLALPYDEMERVAAILLRLPDSPLIFAHKSWTPWRSKSEHRMTRRSL